MSEQSLLRSTLLALARPRRLVPVLVVAVPLVLAQRHYSADPWATALGVVMCLLFLLLAPVSWRALFRGEHHTGRSFGQTFGQPFGRLVVYGAAGMGSVWVVGSLLPRVAGLPVTYLTTDFSLMVAMALFLVGGYGLGRDIELEGSLQRAHARADTMALEAERAQLLALRNHLDPHFLFNTLNAIAEWCREDGETAERATLELAAMLRTIMDTTRLPTWPLERELSLITNLLDLHLIRDPGLFKLISQLPSPLPAVEVPPMVLLPLAENAIKHGPAASHRGDVELHVRVTDSVVEFEISNPGAFAGPRAQGQGLDLVTKRLAHAYAGEATFQITAVGDRTRAVVRLPIAGPTPTPGPTR